MKKIFDEVANSEKEDIKIAEALAENFQEDDLYRYIFPDESVRKKALPIFFLHYLKLIEPYSKKMISTEQLEFVGVIYFSDQFDSRLAYEKRVVLFLISCLKVQRFTGWKGYFKLMKTINKMSSKWIEQEIKGNYIHLDLAITQKKYRGRGWFSKWVEEVENRYGNRAECFTLETQNKENVKLYEKLGFSLVRQIPLPHTEIIQYCMIKNREGKDKSIE